MLTTSHLFQAFESAGAADGLVYMSVPITTGKREIVLMTRLGLSSDQLRTREFDCWRSEVVDRNESDAKRYEHDVREGHRGKLVVNPAHLMVYGWDQMDYNGLWIQLLERYATTVVVTPDWEFSRGARAEVAFAHLLGVPIVKLDGSVLMIEDLQLADKAAKEELRRLGWPQEAADAYLAPLAFDSRPEVQSSPASVTFDWLANERRYQVKKFGTDLDDEHTREGLSDDGWWWRQLTNYYHRARILSLDSPLGRQAIAKFTATACGLVESVVRVHGSLPPPGVPSGET